MNEQTKEETLRFIRWMYKKVKNDECASVESVNAAFSAMYGSETLNKTEAAAFLGIAVSTFNKYLAAGTIPPGTKKRNECLKWRISDLEQARVNMK